MKFEHLTSNAHVKNFFHRRCWSHLGPHHCRPRFSQFTRVPSVKNSPNVGGHHLQGTPREVNAAESTDRQYFFPANLVKICVATMVLLATTTSCSQAEHVNLGARAPEQCYLPEALRWSEVTERYYSSGCLDFLWGEVPLSIDPMAPHDRESSVYAISIDALGLHIEGPSMHQHHDSAIPVGSRCGVLSDGELQDTCLRASRLDVPLNDYRYNHVILPSHRISGVDLIRADILSLWIDDVVVLDQDLQAYLNDLRTKNAKFYPLRSRLIASSPFETSFDAHDGSIWEINVGLREFYEHQAVGLGLMQYLSPTLDIDDPDAASKLAAEYNVAINVRSGASELLGFHQTFRCKGETTPVATRGTIRNFHSAPRFVYTNADDAWLDSCIEQHFAHGTTDPKSHRDAAGWSVDFDILITPSFIPQHQMTREN